MDYNLGGLLQGAMAGANGNTGIMGMPQAAQGAMAGTLPGISQTVAGAQQAGASTFGSPAGLSQAMQGAMSGGQLDLPKLQRMLGLSNEQMTNMVNSGALQQAQNGWLSPEELRARTNGLQSQVSSTPSAGGGGGGSAGGMGGGGSGGGAAPLPGATGTDGLFKGGTPAGTSGSAGGISGFPNVNTGTGLVTGGGLSGVPIGNGQVPGNQIPSGQLPNGQVSGGAGIPMTQANPGNALQNYYNTAGYQLTNGQGAVNQFQASPGYQFAVDQALGQVARQGASRGLLDSGAGLRAMTDRAQGMASQEFNNWQQNQQNQYNQYQNRLQGLASGPTGADQAYGLGQTIGGNAMNVGNNIGSILANQGNSLFGGIVGAGGAQAQNVSQAGNMQAQILGSNLQTQMMLAALAAGQQGVR